MPESKKKGDTTPASRATVGLRDVARTAGVSTATVSRAINNPDLVSDGLRERILSVIDRLGWVPDGAARALTTRRAGVIGAVFPTLSHGDFARATNAIQAELLASGYTLVLACSDYDADQEYRQVRKFIERGVDGVILVGEAHHPKLREFLLGRGVPFVHTFVYSAASQGICIGEDNHRAMFNLTRYLLDLGHVRFAAIAQSTENNDRARARLEGLRDALAERNLAIAPRHFAIGEWTIAEGRALFRQVMAGSPKPTALVCGNPWLAAGAFLESQASCVRVPEALSIVGYDDIELLSELPIPITTVRVASDQVGRHAARFIVGKVEGKPADITFEWPAEIIVRASSGPPPPRPRPRRK